MRERVDLDYSRLYDELVEINENIMFLTVVDIFGKVVKQYYKNLTDLITEEELSSQLKRIAFSSNTLTFENIKLLLLDNKDFKIAVINLNEDSLVVGINKNATWSDVMCIFSYLECLTSHNGVQLI